MQLSSGFNRASLLNEEFMSSRDLRACKPSVPESPAHVRKCYVLQEMTATQQGQLDQHTKASESLFSSIRVMESKLSEAKSKKDTLKVHHCCLKRFP